MAQENARLKQRVAEQALATEALREIVAELVRRGVSARLARRAVGLHRSSDQYRPRPAGEDARRCREASVALAHRHRRSGYRRVAALLRRWGEVVNRKRGWRIWREAGLGLPRRRPRKRRAAAAAARPARAPQRGQVWTYDVAFDATEWGRVRKLLVVLDAFTRACQRSRVGDRRDRAAVLDPPASLRRDNGSECIAAQGQAWLGACGVATVSIAPGHPWENGDAERSVGQRRDECLNEAVCWGEQHTRVIVERWRRADNEARPHRALGDRTPAEAAAAPAGPAGEAAAEAAKAAGGAGRTP
ncbi:MAG TPA: integrase core domain-containing protein [Thermomicrobiales bacterium]|nr:integrase core domain-containing protein [Thermomicrobiales bacterium]